MNWFFSYTNYSSYSKAYEPKYKKSKYNNYEYNNLPRYFSSRYFSSRYFSSRYFSSRYYLDNLDNYNNTYNKTKSDFYNK